MTANVLGNIYLSNTDKGQLSRKKTEPHLLHRGQLAPTVNGYPDAHLLHEWKVLVLVHGWLHFQTYEA